jgi:hypothetical protein
LCHIAYGGLGNYSLPDAVGSSFAKKSPMYTSIFQRLLSHAHIRSLFALQKIRPTTSGKTFSQTDKSNHILGFCPSEAELQEILQDLEEPQSNGYIHIDRFYPIMTKIFMEQK